MWCHCEHMHVKITCIQFWPYEILYKIVHFAVIAIKSSMPLLTAILAVSRVLRQLVGEDALDEERRKERIASSQRHIKAYNEEFIRFFPTVLSILMSRKTSIPRLTTAYDHLEKVREHAKAVIANSYMISFTVHFNFINLFFTVTKLQCSWRWVGEFLYITYHKELHTHYL